MWTEIFLKDRYVSETVSVRVCEEGTNLYQNVNSQRLKLIYEKNRINIL